MREIIGKIGERLRGLPEPAVCILLAMAGVLVYANTLTAGFVSDDKALILKSSRIHSLRRVPAYFSQPFFQEATGGRSTAYYRPVVSAGFALDYAVGGDEAWVYHLTNVAWWAVCVVLVYLLARRLLASREAAVAGAVIFLAHPIHTETVAWISGRTDLFALVLMLGAVLCGLEHREQRGGWWWLVGAFVLGTAAMFCKEVALVLVPLWAVLELTIGRNERHRAPAGRRVAVGGAFLAATILYLAARWIAVGGIAAATGVRNFDPWTPAGMGTVARCVWEYLGKLALPVQLSFAFEFDPFTGPPGVLALLCAAGGLGLLGLSVYAGVRRPRMGFWMWWMWLGLAPAVNFVPINEVVAERFAFVASVGYCMLLGMAFGRVLGSGASWNRRRLAMAALVLLAGGLALRTVRRNADWQSERTLYLSAVRTAPDRPMAHTLAAEVYLSDPRVPERALLHYRRALELAGGKSALRFVLHNALGQVHRQMGDREEALLHFREALGVRPGSPVARTNLGLLLIAFAEEEGVSGALEPARRELERVVEGHPDYADGHFALGYWQMQHGDDPRRAVELLGRAAELDGTFDMALYFQALALLELGEEARAESVLLEAIRRNPANVEARYRLARLYLDRGREREALQQARQALRIRKSQRLVSLIEQIQARIEGP